MALIIGNKALFIHVPKTGGTFIRKYCESNYVCGETGKFKVHDHYSIEECYKENALIKDLASFGFVRHPVEWLKSRWAWAVLTKFDKKIETEADAQAHWMAKVWDNNYEEFVKKYLIAGKAEAWNTFHDKLQIGETNQVNYIGRYENLGYDLVNILKMSGLDGYPSELNMKEQKVGAKGKLKAKTKSNTFIDYQIMEIECDVIKKFYSCY